MQLLDLILADLSRPSPADRLAAKARARTAALLGLSEEELEREVARELGRPVPDRRASAA